MGNEGVNLMPKIKPIQASPEFIRDNQYNENYIVITKNEYPSLFDLFLEYHGSERLMYFPSGLECFFCKINKYG